MKKLLLLFVVLFCTMSFSQKVIFPEVFKFENMTNDNTEVKNVWIVAVKNMIYYKKYNINPIGIKHLFDDVKMLCYSNNIDFAKPFFDRSYLASYNKDVFDYERTNMAVQRNESEIEMIWVLNRSKISVTLKKDSYQIDILELF